MGHVVLLNLVFFLPAVSGASAFAWWVVRILRAPAPPSGEDGGTSGHGFVRPEGPSGTHLHAGRDDELARSV